MHDDFVGTMPVPERHRFDISSLDRYLRGHVEGYTGGLELEQFKGGQSNPTFMLKSGKRRYVLRRKPPGKLLPSAHAVDREYRVITALHASGFPVAKTYCLCEDDAIIGTAFYVMECVAGRVLWDPALPGMDPRQRDAHFDRFEHAPEPRILQNRGMELCA